MPSNVVSAVLLTALLFTSLVLAVDFAVESVKSLKMAMEAERAEGILQKFASLENGSISFWGDGTVQIRERDVLLDYCGISEVLKAYSICYKYNFSKCVETVPEVSAESREHGAILNLKAVKIFHGIVSEPGRHSILIEKRILQENCNTFELINQTEDPALNLSARISEKTRCGENLRLEIDAGNSSESRYAAILERGKLEKVRNASFEEIRDSSRWFSEIGNGSRNLEYLIETTGWPPGFYGVLIFSNSHRNDNMTFLVFGNASIDYGFSKLNFTDVECIRKRVEEVRIYEKEWNS
jgi:hypothetical protein